MLRGWRGAPAAAVSDDGLDEVRRRLEARVDDCWDRVDDAISELTALHGVDVDEILARVDVILEQER